MDISITEITALCSDIKIHKSFLSSKAIHEPSGQPLKKHVFYITDANALEMSKGLANDNLSCTAHFNLLDNGKNRLEVFMTPDGQFAAVRLYEFVPYNYAPRTEWAFFRKEACKALYILAQKAKI